MGHAGYPIQHETKRMFGKSQFFFNAIVFHKLFMNTLDVLGLMLME